MLEWLPGAFQLGVNVLPRAPSCMFVNVCPIPHEGTGAERRRDIPEYIWLSLAARKGARSDASGGYTLLLERERSTEYGCVRGALCIARLLPMTEIFSASSPYPPRWRPTHVQGKKMGLR